MINDGKAMGKWKWYYETGQLKTIGEYIDGKEVGIWKTLYLNGNLHIESSFGKLQMVRKEYGNLTKTIIHNYKSDSIL